MNHKSHIQFSALTDLGLTRRNNEDSFMVLSGDGNTYVVILADGMGGHKRGELASSIAVKYIAERLSLEMKVGMSPEDIGQLVRGIIEKANVRVHLKSLDDEHNEGMGTTVTVGIFQNNQLIVAHVGDCRAYLMHNSELSHLTIDHTLVQTMVQRGELTPEEAVRHPKRNVITRALGTPEYTSPDVGQFEIGKGDRILFSSDGLHDYVDEADIERILKAADTPKRAAEELVAQANRVGGADNVTVIVGFA
jgi:serine/threonine protein phosphatase PrpC